MRRIRRCIKPKLRPRAKRILSGLVLTILAMGGSPSALLRAAPRDTHGISQHETDSFPPPLLDANVAEIEARTYDVKVLKQSESEKVFKFEDTSGAKPFVGNIILLRRGGEPVLALRVLRNEIDKKVFFARRVRRYGNTYALPEGEVIAAVERTSEISLPLPPSDDDEKDMRELGAESPEFLATPSASGGAPATAAPPANDSPLDDSAALDNAAGSPVDGGGDAALDSPANHNSAVAGVSADEALDSPQSRNQGDFSLNDDVSMSDRGPASAIDEVEPMDRLNQALSGEVGFFKGNDVTATGGSPYYTGMGLRYGLTLGRMVLMRRAKVQDSVVVEGGAFMYRLANYLNVGDAYTVVPFIATLRYNIFLNQTIGVYFHGGLARSQVVGSSEATDAGLAKLNSVGPAFGGGLLFTLGPHWSARVDAGLEMIGGGLMISF